MIVYSGLQYPVQNALRDEKTITDIGFIKMASRSSDRKTVILPGIKSTLDIHHPLVVNGSGNETFVMTCHSDAESEAVILVTLAGLGMAANLMLMILIIRKAKLRW